MRSLCIVLAQTRQIMQSAVLSPKILSIYLTKSTSLWGTDSIWVSLIRCVNCKNMNSWRPSRHRRPAAPVEAWAAPSPVGPRRGRRQRGRVGTSGPRVTAARAFWSTGNNSPNSRNSRSFRRRHSKSPARATSKVSSKQGLVSRVFVYTVSWVFPWLIWLSRL